VARVTDSHRINEGEARQLDLGMATFVAKAFATASAVVLQPAKIR